MRWNHSDQISKPNISLLFYYFKSLG